MIFQEFAQNRLARQPASPFRARRLNRCAFTWPRIDGAAVASFASSRSLGRLMSTLRWRAYHAGRLAYHASPGVTAQRFAHICRQFTAPRADADKVIAPPAKAGECRRTNLCHYAGQQEHAGDGRFSRVYATSMSPHHCSSFSVTTKDNIFCALRRAPRGVRARPPRRGFFITPRATPSAYARSRHTAASIK